MFLKGFSNILKNAKNKKQNHKVNLLSNIKTHTNENRRMERAAMTAAYTASSLRFFIAAMARYGGMHQVAVSGKTRDRTSTWLRV